MEVAADVVAAHGSMAAVAQTDITVFYGIIPLQPLVRKLLDIGIPSDLAEHLSPCLPAQLGGSRSTVLLWWWKVEAAGSSPEL